MANIQRERESEREKEGKEGRKKRERKNRREVYFGRNRSASDSIGLATRYPAIIFAVIGGFPELEGEDFAFSAV